MTDVPDGPCAGGQAGRVTLPELPRDPVVDRAVTLARAWCDGHVIDGETALGHALRVAGRLVKHVPDASPGLVAAVLVHDASYLAPEGVDVYAAITAHLGDPVVEVVRALEREDRGRNMPFDSSWVLYASTAHKIVTIEARLREAAAASDPAGFWRLHRPFLARLTYLRAFHTGYADYLPEAMANELGRLIADLDTTTRDLRRSIATGDPGDHAAGPA